MPNSHSSSSPRRTVRPRVLSRPTAFFVALLGAVSLTMLRLLAAPVGLAALDVAYTQNFNTLASAGSSSALPAGWELLETGTSASVNGAYSAGTGSNNAGDMYSFGAAASAERALGGLLSGSLTPTFGASFINNTSGTITSLDVAYVGAGVGQLWDDETMLGRGLEVSGGVSTGLGDHVRVAAGVDLLSHTRALTYLGVDGHATSALGRVSYVFGATATPVRPYAGLGVGLMHSTGTLKTPVAFIAANGQPTLSTTVKEATDWSLTRSMWEAHAGLRIAAGRGLALRPEMRWRATFGSGASSEIEPPLLGTEGLLSLEWSRSRR